MAASARSRVASAFFCAWERRPVVFRCHCFVLRVMLCPPLFAGCSQGGDEWLEDWQRAAHTFRACECSRVVGAEGICVPLLLEPLSQEGQCTCIMLAPHSSRSSSVTSIDSRPRYRSTRWVRSAVQVFHLFCHAGSSRAASVL